MDFFSWTKVKFGFVGSSPMASVLCGRYALSFDVRRPFVGGLVNVFIFCDD